MNLDDKMQVDNELEVAAPGDVKERSGIHSDTLSVSDIVEVVRPDTTASHTSTPITTSQLQYAANPASQTPNTVSPQSQHPSVQPAKMTDSNITLPQHLSGISPGATSLESAGDSSNRTSQPDTATSPAQPQTTAAESKPKFKKSKPINKDLISQEWTLRDKALFRRALVKYGPNFTDIAMMIGTKTYTIVKDYYKQLGGGKTKWIKPLLQAHTRLKRTNQLDSWSTELSAEEEEAIKLGKLIQIVEEEEQIEDFPDTTTPKSAGPTATSTVSTTDPDYDPTVGLTDAQRKEYTKYKVELILRANQSNIFQADSFQTFESAALKKAPLIKKPNFVRQRESTKPSTIVTLSSSTDKQQNYSTAPCPTRVNVAGLGAIATPQYFDTPMVSSTLMFPTKLFTSTSQGGNSLKFVPSAQSKYPSLDSLSPNVIALRAPTFLTPPPNAPNHDVEPVSVKPLPSLHTILNSRKLMWNATLFASEKEIILKTMQTHVLLTHSLKNKYSASQHYQWFHEKSFMALSQQVLQPIVADSDGLITYLSMDLQQGQLAKSMGEGGLATKQFATVTIWKGIIAGQSVDLLANSKICEMIDNEPKEVLFDVGACMREFSRDGSLLAISNGKLIYLVDAVHTSKTFGMSLLKLTGHATSLVSLKFSPLGFLASADRTGLVRIWNTRNIASKSSTEFKYSKTFKDNNQLAKLMFAPGFVDVIVTASPERSARIWDLASSTYQPRVVLRVGDTQQQTTPSSSTSIEGPTFLFVGSPVDKPASQDSSPVKQSGSATTAKSPLYRWLLALHNRTLFLYDLRKPPSSTTPMQPCATLQLPPAIQCCTAAEIHPYHPSILLILSVPNSTDHSQVPSLHVLYVKVSAPKKSATHAKRTGSATAEGPTASPSVKIELLESYKYHPGRQIFTLAQDIGDESSMHVDMPNFQTGSLQVVAAGSIIVVTLEEQKASASELLPISRVMFIKLTQTTM